mmetsp:Transcript_8905/g.32858  ORF Transcript_8905/g.32858 Transcript_8905/m.32858 type:complete len:94 (+) Transcript_8905:81-362(+)
MRAVMIIQSSGRRRYQPSQAKFDKDLLNPGAALMVLLFLILSGGALLAPSLRSSCEVVTPPFDDSESPPCTVCHSGFTHDFTSDLIRRVRCFI